MALWLEVEQRFVIMNIANMFTITLEKV